MERVETEENLLDNHFDLEVEKTLLGPDHKFYAWECVSLITVDHTSVDFVIRDKTDLMSLLHILYHGLSPIKINCAKKDITQKNEKATAKKPKNDTFCLSMYLALRLKMKLSYMARMKQTSVIELWF